MEVLKQLRKRFENVNNSVSRWAVGLMFLFMVAAPIELEAQRHSRSRFGYRTGVRDLFSCNK